MTRSYTEHNADSPLFMLLKNIYAILNQPQEKQYFSNVYSVSAAPISYVRRPIAVYRHHQPLICRQSAVAPRIPAINLQ